MNRSKNIVKQLLDQQKTVLIDACLPMALAEGLRRRGLIVRHLHEIDSGMSDDEVAEIMLPSDILLTRDHQFFKKMEDRAILMPLCIIDGRKSKRGRDQAKERHKKYRHSGAFKQWQFEERMGFYEFRIKRGMRINFFRKATKEERIHGKGDYIPI